MLVFGTGDLDEFRRDHRFDFGFGSRWCNLRDAKLMNVENFLDKFSLRTEVLSIRCIKHAHHYPTRLLLFSWPSSGSIRWYYCLEDFDQMVLSFQVILSVNIMLRSLTLFIRSISIPLIQIGEISIGCLWNEITVSLVLSTLGIILLVVDHETASFTRVCI